MRQELIDLYDQYTHSAIGRRSFMVQLAKLTGGAAAAAGAFAVLHPTNSAEAAVIPENDPRVKSERIGYPGKTGEVKGYLAMPAAGGKNGAVIVIHENRGLNPHLEDVARKLAVDGFVAFAVDLLSPMGGTPSNEDTARDMIGKLDNDSTVENLVALVTFLEKHPASNGKVGVVGFCWGGQKVNQLAVAAPGLDAAVSYYGRQVSESDTAKIQAPLMLHYAGEDANINGGIAAYEAALKQHNKRYEVHMYPGSQHAFNNDTNESRYHKPSADQAWSRTVTFFKKNLA